MYIEREGGNERMCDSWLDCVAICCPPTQASVSVPVCLVLRASIGAVSAGWADWNGTNCNGSILLLPGYRGHRCATDKRARTGGCGYECCL